MSSSSSSSSYYQTNSQDYKSVLRQGGVDEQFPVSDPNEGFVFAQEARAPDAVPSLMKCPTYWRHWESKKLVCKSYRISKTDSAAGFYYQTADGKDAKVDYPEIVLAPQVIGSFVRLYPWGNLKVSGEVTKFDKADLREATASFKSTCLPFNSDAVDEATGCDKEAIENYKWLESVDRGHWDVVSSGGKFAGLFANAKDSLKHLAIADSEKNNIAYQQSIGTTYIPMVARAAGSDGSQNLAGGFIPFSQRCFNNSLAKFPTFQIELGGKRSLYYERSEQMKLGGWTPNYVPMFGPDFKMLHPDQWELRQGDLASPIVVLEASTWVNPQKKEQCRVHKHLKGIVLFAQGVTIVGSRKGAFADVPPVPGACLITRFSDQSALPDNEWKKIEYKIANDPSFKKVDYKAEASAQQQQPMLQHQQQQQPVLQYNGYGSNNNSSSSYQPGPYQNQQYIQQQQQQQQQQQPQQQLMPPPPRAAQPRFAPSPVVVPPRPASYGPVITKPATTTSSSSTLPLAANKPTASTMQIEVVPETPAVQKTTPQPSSATKTPAATQEKEKEKEKESEVEGTDADEGEQKKAGKGAKRRRLQGGSSASKSAKQKTAAPAAPAAPESVDDDLLSNI